MDDTVRCDAPENLVSQNVSYSSRTFLYPYFNPLWGRLQTCPLVPKRGKKLKKHIVVNVCLILSVLFVLYFTLRSHPDLGIGDPGARINIKPFESITFDPVKGLALNTVGNVLLFVPFGLCVAFKLKGKFRLFKVVFWGGLFSFSIEMIQLFLPNRWTDIDDIILNTTGAFLGYLLCLIPQDLRPKG